MPGSVSQQVLETYSSPVDLWSLIQSAGLTSSVLYSLDAADAGSYPGSGTTWSDRSGQGNDFTLTNSPTFNGTAGTLSSSTYFSANGSTSGFKFAGTWPPSWAPPIHKAGGKFSFIAALQFSTTTSTGGIVGDSNGSSTVGFQYSQNGSSQLYLSVGNGSGIITTLNSIAISTGSWLFAGVSFNNLDTTNGISHQVNAGTSSVTGAYSGSPSASNPNSTMGIMVRGWSGTTAQFGSSNWRIGCCAAWNDAIGFSGLSAVYNKLKPRYGF